MALQNPYDIAYLTHGSNNRIGAGRAAEAVPAAPAASLATYCWTDVQLRAAARVIAGRANPRGRLPVPVQRADAPHEVLYPTGHGLSY